jgi:hypothetical protein
LLSSLIPSARVTPEDALVVTLFLAALAGIYWWARVRQRDELWVRPIRNVCKIIALALATQVPYALYHKETSLHPASLVLLQLAKDGPGLLLVALMVGIVARKNAYLATRSPALRVMLEACPRVFIWGFVLAGLWGLLGGLPGQLEAGPAPAAVLYRALIFGPMAFYSLLISWLLAADARMLGRLDGSLGRRYVLFSAGALSWVLLATDHLARPSLILLLDAADDAGVLAAANATEGLLWILMAFFWIYGYASGRKVSQTDLGLSLTDSYRERSTRLNA